MGPLTAVHDFSAPAEAAFNTMAVAAIRESFVMKRYGLLSVFAALVLTACGNGSVKSPDFEPQLLNITVTSTKASVGTGETAQFKATGTFSGQPGAGNSERDITNSVDWSSTDTAVATIDAAGLATGTGQGTTTIKASRDGKQGSVTLTGEGIVLRQIKITPPQGATAPGGTVDYIAQGIYSNSPTPQDITDATINWSIADPSIGTISPATGRKVTVTGVTPGLTTIKATAKGIEGIAQFGVGQLARRGVRRRGKNRDGNGCGGACGVHRILLGTAVCVWFLHNLRNPPPRGQEDARVRRR